LQRTNMNKLRTNKVDAGRTETVSGATPMGEAIDRDFGAVTDRLHDGVSRRRWLQLMGASRRGRLGARAQ